MDVRTTTHRTRSVLLLLGLVALVVSISAAPARAVVPYADISTPGPMEHIYLGDELSCQVKLAGDGALSFYPSTVIPGDCGTFLITGGTLYYPKFPSHGSGCSPCTATSGLPNPKVQYTTVSQTPISGTGAAGDPYTVTTVADAASTGLRITRSDSYVTGDHRYLSEITVSNSGATAATAKLYHAADCFLAGSDNGYGWAEAASEGIFCAANANNSPPDRIIGFQPADAASAGPGEIEALYSNVWSAINGTLFPNTCVCTTSIDNGAGLSWSITVPASGQVTRKVWTTVFAPPRLSIGDEKVIEGNTPAGTRGGPPPPVFLNFRVRLAAPADHTVTVDFATADDTAISPDDYTATTGTLTFQPGKTVRTAAVPINGEVTDEANEFLDVTLSSPTPDAVIEDGSARGKIVDDDSPPTILMGDAARREGSAVRLPVSLTNPSSRKVRAQFATADGDAMAPDDYTAESGQVTFAPGEVAKTISITTIQDMAQENDETFTVTLSSPEHGVIGVPTGTGTILNDDAD